MIGMSFALFALALVAALLWIRLASVERRLDSLTNMTAARTPAAVTAAIEDLRTAVASINATNRREFGALWKRVGLSRAVAQAENELPLGGPAANDDAFTAMIALQSADPVKPK